MDEEHPDVFDDSVKSRETESGEKGESNEEYSSSTACEIVAQAFQGRRSKIPCPIANPFTNHMVPKFARVQMPQIGTSSEMIKRLTRVNGVYDQIAKPVLSATWKHSSWAKSLGVINSDITTGLRVPQLPTQTIIDRITKNVDLGAITQYKRFADQIRIQQASWFKSIIPNLDKLKAAFWPPNLRDIEDLGFDDVHAVVMLNGIGLYNVPRRNIATALIRANSVQKRREILGRRWKAISSDCRDAVSSCESEALDDYVAAVLAALDALEAGHTHAAQALVGALTDALLIDYLGERRYDYTPNKKNKNTDAYKKFGMRKFIAFAPMWQAYQQFWAKNGDAVPVTFNRNATAHTVSGRQFNRRNTIQGLLFVCGLVTFLQEAIQRRQA